MTTLHFTAIPLTPIHVGSGDTLVPEDYLLRDDELIRFNRSAVLRDMKSEVRQRLETVLDRAQTIEQLAQAQEIVRGACDPARHALGRIAISDASRQALQTVIKGTDANAVGRSREVHPFVHNPQTGRPYLPGSSIKGAIRTAIVNHFTHKHLKSIGPVVERAEVRNQARTLEGQALNYDFRNLEGDPLRLFKVADAELPDGCTRIDRALRFERGKGFNDIQMHFERLLSQGDGEPVSFPVELELDEIALSHQAVRNMMGRTLSFDLIRLACNTFYTGRLLAEHQRFFSDDTAPEARYGAQGLIKLQPGKILIAKSLAERNMLLRVGRFSHFESLSVDDLRQGWNIQRRQAIKEGSTRTLCRRAGLGGAVPMPFGWLLLQPTG